MHKYIFPIVAIAAGIITCKLAPASWRLIGVFCAGGGCYAIIEIAKLRRIEQEIERFERSGQPVVKAQPRRRRVTGKRPYRIGETRNTLPDMAA